MNVPIGLVLLWLGARGLPADDPQPGRYLSPASDTLAYHTREHPEITWDAATTLYGRGDTAVRDAVAQRIYQVVYLRSVSTAGHGQDVLLAALALSPDYEPDMLGPDGLPNDMTATSARRVIRSVCGSRRRGR